MNSNNIIPYPSLGFFPKILRDNPDAGTIALSNKLDSLMRRWESSGLLLYYLNSPERCPTKYLQELGILLSAGIYSYDSETEARKKLRDAVQRHKLRGTFDVRVGRGDVKIKIDSITGLSSELVTFIRDDLFTWIMTGADGTEAGKNWALVDGCNPAEQRLGLGIVTDGNELEIQGVVYIDLGSADLSADVIERIKISIEDSVPAYFRIFLGYLMDPVVFWSQLHSNADITAPQVGNAGTITGSIAYTPARFGNGTQSGGMVNFYKFDNMDLITDVTKAFTISIWHRPSISSGPGAVTSELFMAGAFIGNQMLKLYWSAGSQILHVHINNGITSATFDKNILGFDWSAGDDIFLAVAFDPPNGVIKLFFKNYTTGQAMSCLPTSSSIPNPFTLTTFADTGLRTGPSYGPSNNLKVYPLFIDVFRNFELEYSPSQDSVDEGVIPFWPYPNGIIG